MHKFLLYQGLTTYYNITKDTSEQMMACHKICMAATDVYERSLMDVFNCDPDWQICLFDFTQKNKNPTFVSLRVGKDLDHYIENDYFYGDQNLAIPGRYEPGRTPIVTRDDLMIERLPHLCCKKEFPNFEHNFKKRYEAMDTSLL